MSVCYEIAEEITVNNTGERTARILEYVKNRIPDMMNLKNTGNLNIGELTVEKDGEVHTAGNLRSSVNDKQVWIKLPPETAKNLGEITSAKKVKISLKYSYEFIYVSAEEGRNRVSLTGISDFLTEDDLDDVRYAALVTCDCDWNTSLFVCDRKNGVNRFGYQEPDGDFAEVSGLDVWRTGNTAIQIDLDVLPGEKERFDGIAEICKALSERLSSFDDPVQNDSKFYFAMNGARFQSEEDILFYTERVKELYKRTDGQIYTEPVFMHASDKGMAVMKMFFDEGGHFIIGTARS